MECLNDSRSDSGYFAHFAHAGHRFHVMPVAQFTACRSVSEEGRLVTWTV